MIKPNSTASVLDIRVIGVGTLTLFIVGARKSLEKLTLPAMFHANKSGYWLKFSTSNNRNSV